MEVGAFGDARSSRETPIRAALLHSRFQRVASRIEYPDGTPDTMPNVPRQSLARRSGPPIWLLIAAVLVIAGVGYAVGFYLGRG